MENMGNIEKENPYPEELTLEAKLLKLKKEKQESDAEIKELKEEKKKLEEELKNRDKFFSIVAHDLKSPMNSVIGFSELLHKNIENLPKEKIVNFAEVIHGQGKKIVKLIEDLVVLYNAQKDTIKPKLLSIDLHKKIDDSIDPLKQDAETKGVKLENLKTEHINVQADPEMLQVVIRNLVSNAIKFSEKGGNVSIYGERKNNKVEIYVMDDGVGLTAEEKEKVLDSLGVSKYGTSGEKGTGLGLSVCKEFVEKMGGTLSVESEGKDKGTKFIITLPAGEEVKKEQ